MSDEENKPNVSIFGERASVAVSAESLADKLEASGGKDPRAQEGVSFMSFSGKRGAYKIGRDGRAPDKDEIFLVAVFAFQDGNMCWKGGKPIDTKFYPIGTPVPAQDPEEGGPFDKSRGEGWSQAKTMTAKSLDSGEQVYFTTSTASSVSVFADLQRQVAERLRAGQPHWPVITFGMEEFEAKGHKNFKPVFNVDGWLNDKQVTTDLPAIFDDPDAEIDMDALYEAATSLGLGEEDDGEDAPIAAAAASKPVRRRRRG